MYKSESTGRIKTSPDNGFAYGKRNLNVTVAMWNEDIYIFLYPHELYSDPNLPNWWLDKIFATRKKDVAKQLGLDDIPIIESSN